MLCWEHHCYKYELLLLYTFFQSHSSSNSWCCYSNAVSPESKWQQQLRQRHGFPQLLKKSPEKAAYLPKYAGYDKILNPFKGIQINSCSISSQPLLLCLMIILVFYLVILFSCLHSISLEWFPSSSSSSSASSYIAVFFFFSFRISHTTLLYSSPSLMCLYLCAFSLQSSITLWRKLLHDKSCCYSSMIKSFFILNLLLVTLLPLPLLRSLSLTQLLSILLHAHTYAYSQPAREIYTCSNKSRIQYTPQNSRTHILLSPV